LVNTPDIIICIREIRCRYRIFKIKKAKILNFIGVEKLFQNHNFTRAYALVLSFVFFFGRCRGFSFDGIARSLLAQCVAQNR